MFLEGEPGHGIVRLGFETAALQPSFDHDAKNRQRVLLTLRACSRDARQMIDERHDENGLARALQAGDSEPQRRCPDQRRETFGGGENVEQEI